MSYAADGINLGVATLCACAAFRSLAGAADATAALAWVVKTTSGGLPQNGARLGKGKAANGSEIDLDQPGYATVGIPGGLVSTAGGVSSWDTDFPLGIRLHMPRVVGIETPAEAAQRAWDTADDIRKQILEQVAAGTSFCDCDVDIQGLFMDTEGPYRDMTIAEITINVRG